MTFSSFRSSSKAVGANEIRGRRVVVVSTGVWGLPTPPPPPDEELEGLDSKSRDGGESIPRIPGFLVISDAKVVEDGGRLFIATDDSGGSPKGNGVEYARLPSLFMAVIEAPSVSVETFLKAGLRGVAGRDGVAGREETGVDLAGGVVETREDEAEAGVDIVRIPLATILCPPTSWLEFVGVDGRGEMALLVGSGNSSESLSELSAVFSGTFGGVLLTSLESG